MARHLLVLADNEPCVKIAQMNEQPQQIAYELLTYLAENPDAQDTLEGIVEWWLLERAIKHQTLEVKKALAMLVAQGLVLERKGKDARTYYKVNRRKLGKILLLLKQRSEKDGPAIQMDSPLDFQQAE